MQRTREDYYHRVPDSTECPVASNSMRVLESGRSGHCKTRRQINPSVGLAQKNFVCVPRDIDEWPQKCKYTDVNNYNCIRAAEPLSISSANSTCSVFFTVGSSHPSDGKNLLPPSDEEGLLKLGRDTGKHTGVRLPCISTNSLFQMASGSGRTVTGGSGK